MAKDEKHKLAASYTNDYGQRTDVCVCGAAVDNIDVHVIDQARVAKRQAEHDKEIKELLA